MELRCRRPGQDRACGEPPDAPAALSSPALGRVGHDDPSGDRPGDQSPGDLGGGVGHHLEQLREGGVAVSGTERGMPT